MRVPATALPSLPGYTKVLQLLSEFTEKASIADLSSCDFLASADILGARTRDRDGVFEGGLAYAFFPGIKIILSLTSLKARESCVILIGPARASNRPSMLAVVWKAC